MPDSALPVLEAVDTGDGYSLDIDFFLKHDYNDIGEAMEKLPAIIEYVNSRLQSITEQKIIAKQAVRGAEARAYFTLRQGGFEDKYTGKVTETALVQAMHLDENVVESHRNYAVLAGWSQRLSNLLMSLQVKLDMVRSTEATRRELAKSDEEDED